MHMTRFSAAMVAAFAMACGGGGKKADTTPMPEGGTATTTDTAMKASTDQAPADEPADKPADKPAEPPPAPKVMKSMTPTELAWTPLMPDAGDKGPMVAALWGDMQKEANGFFIKLPAGGKGVLHTHANDYHGVGITASTAGQDGGKVHPVAQGTYWFQPGGTAHINGCPGKTPCVVLVSFPTAKFDFAPAQAAKGAKPDPKAVEKTVKAAKWTPLDEKNPKGAQTSVLWGDPASGPSGRYVKIKAGSQSSWHTHKSDVHGVVLAGTVNHIESGADTKDLPVGSYWMQPGGNKHTTNCKAGGPDCVVYIYAVEAWDVTPAEEAKAEPKPETKPLK